MMHSVAKYSVNKCCKGHYVKRFETFVLCTNLEVYKVGQK